jgi:acyl-CoA synthetase (AMP-forming)/AMP-acid ligase II/acyl carrier protein
LNRTIAQLIKGQAEKSPNATAIGSLDRAPLNYHDLYQQVLTTHEQLRSFGIGRNDCVAIILPNGPQMAGSFLAISASATTAPLNPSYRHAELEFYLRDLQACAVVLEKDRDSAAKEVALSLNIPVIELAPSQDAVSGKFILHADVDKSPARDEFAQPDDVALMLHTSGTTSKPKIVPLSHHNLSTSAHNISTSLHLTPQDRCLNVMPLFHIHGLVASLLASIFSGASVLCSPGFYAPKFFEWIAAYKPTWYTAVPTMHQAILDRAPANQGTIEQTQFRFIRSCSAALPPTLMRELEATFNAPVVEAYGMTEASHQMTCNPLPPQTRKPGSVGVATGVEVAILSEHDDSLLPSEQIGEIVIRGLNVTKGYVNNPEANAHAFSNTWFRTGDQGYLDSEHYLFITGRIKEIINRGGEKISPREVDEVLLDHPLVSQALTFAMPDPTLGEDVAAAVIAKDSSLTASELRKFANTRLAYFKVPRQIIFLDEIPKGPTGKPQRIGLAEQLGITNVVRDQDHLEIEYIAPRDPIEELLGELWMDVLNLERIGVHNTFLSVGGDSLLALQLISRLRESLNINISLLDFFDAPTIAEQADIVQEMLLHEHSSSENQEE